MKKQVFQSVAVITAFIVGVTINNSCGDGQYEDNSQSIASLWSAVNSLKSEVSELKKEVAALKNGSGSTGAGGSAGSATACGEFKVGDLYFFRGGTVASKIKSLTSNDGQTFYEYEYDADGRLLVLTHTIVAGETTTVSRQVYSYSGKSATLTQYISVNGTQQTSKLEYEYY